MKQLKQKLSVVLFLYGIYAFAQQPPTGGPPPLNNPPAQANAAWYRGGNTNSNGINNIFGTLWNSPVYHFTSGQRRMTLFDNTYSTASFGPNNSTPFGGGLAINLNPASPINAPRSLLHIGEDLDPFTLGSSGWRTWMRVGTYNNFGSDNFYVGLKSEGQLDRNDAVLAWGDDFATYGNANQFAPDFLRFIFTRENFNPANPNAPDGLGLSGKEIARMAPDGMVGIGNFYNDPLFPTNHPSRRLEILSNKLAANAAGDPQFRITHTQQNPFFPNFTGKFTDFHTTQLGDMAFNTRDNTQVNTGTLNLKERFFGFNTNTPGNTVEINSQYVAPNLGNGQPAAPGFPLPTGWSGLRFTDLNSNSIPQLNPGPGLLSVNGNGDVIYVPRIPANSNNGLTIVGDTIQLGALCGSPTVALANLLNHRQIPLNNFNLIFSENVGGLGRVGIGKNIGCNPGNQLEINNGIPGPVSGLRLTDLAGATPLPSNNQVLSVNAGGDVILTQLPTTSGFGNLCTAPQNPITGNFEIPLGTFRYKFTGQGLIDNVTKEDIVSVGYSCAQIPPSRFSVLENQTTQPVSVQTYAGHFNNNNASTPVFTGIPIETAGLYAEAKQNIIGPPNYVNHNIGAIHEATGSINSIGTVGRIAKSSLPINQIGPRYAIGGAFMSDTAVTNNALPSVQNIGVYASAFNSPANNYGVYAETAPDPNGIASSYGIFAKTVGANPTFPSLAGNYAGYFDGDVVVNGNFAFTSDASLKHNFDSIPNALQLINQLKPTKFEFNTNQYPQMALAQGQQYGLVAQEVFSVMPAIVGTAKHPEIKVGSTTYPAFTYSTVEYQQLIPVLIRAVQQLSAQNQKLDSMLTALKQTVNACCSNSNARATGIQGNQPNAVSQLNIDLSDKDVIVLNQNVPNPFAEQTTITYNVPEKYGFAQLVFKTVDGKIIKTVDITKKGRGQVNVFANDLSNGLYMYSLVVDGVVVDTKKMVKQ